MLCGAALWRDIDQKKDPYRQYTSRGHQLSRRERLGWNPITLNHTVVRFIASVKKWPDLSATHLRTLSDSYLIEVGFHPALEMELARERQPMTVGAVQRLGNLIQWKETNFQSLQRMRTHFTTIQPAIEEN